MAVTLTTPNTLLGTFVPKSDATRLVSTIATVVLGTLFITLCSKINVPTWPVPVTLQTFGVAALAAAFGWRVGAMLLGDAVVLAVGFAWLLALAGNASWIDHSNVVGSAFAKAVQPFIVWDALKMAFAALTVTGIWALLRRKA